jgi:hypothetical protein
MWLGRSEQSGVTRNASVFPICLTSGDLDEFRIAMSLIELDEWYALKSLFDDRIDFAPLTTESRMSTIVSHRRSNVFRD